MIAANWEVSLSKQRELRSKGVEVLHERVSLLKEVNDSAEFAAWCDENGVIAEDYLQREVDDVGIAFRTLLAVLAQFPNVSEWQSRSVRVLVAEVLETQKRDRKPVERIGWKERAIKAEAEVERLKVDLAQASATIAELRNSLTIVASRGQHYAA